MAALTGLQVFSDGLGHKVTLYRILGVNTLDSIDLAADFKKIVSVRTIQVSSSLADFAVAPTVVGTVITLTAANLLNDAVYLLVSGGST